MLIFRSPGIRAITQKHIQFIGNTCKRVCLCNKKTGVQLQDEERLAGGARAGKELDVLAQMDTESEGWRGGCAGPHFLGKRDCIAQQPLASYLMAQCLLLHQ